MEIVSGQGYRVLLVIGELDFGGVAVGVECAVHGQAGCGGGVGDEVDDDAVGFQGPSAPVPGDLGEESVFNLVKASG
jgi:hypothetical protein